MKVAATEDHRVEKQGVHLGVEHISTLENHTHVVTETTNKSFHFVYPGIEMYPVACYKK